MSKPRNQEWLIWALAALVLAGAGAAVAFHVGDLRALTTPHLPWWALALGFAAAERAVIHLHFRRSAHSFTLADIPLVFGLIFASAPQLLIGALAGSTVMWILDRRLPPIKIAFNLAQLALAICLAETIVHAYTNHVQAIHPALWLVILLAVESGGLVTVALIGAAITLSEGKLPEGMLGQMFGFDLVFTVTNTALALAAAILIKASAAAVPLMLLPAASFYLAYRAYLLQRQRNERLDFLYEITRTVAQSPDVTGVLEVLLERSRDAFQVELAELVLFSTDGHVPLRISRSSASSESMVPVDSAAADGLRELVATQSPAAIAQLPSGDTPLGNYFRERGVEQAILAQLPGDGRVAGTLMLANRVGVVRKFDAEDLKLLGALATNTSVALQFDRLEQAVWQLRNLRDELEHQRSHDPLTNLPNRAMFVAQVKRGLERDRGLVALLFIDVDDFKSVNDRHGHSGGDDLLSAIADRLRDCVLPGDLIGRLGGDEFAILLQEVPDAGQAGLAVADRIVQRLATPVTAGRQRVPVQVSIGIATGRAGYEDAEELIGNADVALHQAKHAGQGPAVLFEPRMRSATIERHSLKGDLEQALGRGQFGVDYQPIVSLADGHVVGAEALVRWRRKYGKVLTAADFIPLAQETGVILPLGEFVLGEACREASNWLGSGRFGADLAVHVNLSAIELGDPMLVSRVGDMLEQTGLPPHLLVLEVSESAILRDQARATTHLTELRTRGVRLALDDFGTGYSSLDYLRDLPFSYLKVARSFVEGLTDRPREVAFVRTIKQLCETLGLQIVASGIETKDQWELLKSLGCDLGQGYLIGHPGAADSIFAGAYPMAGEPGAWLRGLTEELPRP